MVTFRRNLILRPFHMVLLGMRTDIAVAINNTPDATN
jgi:hypothetical protein